MSTTSTSTAASTVLSLPETFSFEGNTYKKYEFDDGYGPWKIEYLFNDDSDNQTGMVWALITKEGIAIGKRRLRRQESCMTDECDCQVCQLYLHDMCKDAHCQFKHPKNMQDYMNNHYTFLPPTNFDGISTNHVEVTPINQVETLTTQKQTTKVGRLTVFDMCLNKETCPWHGPTADKTVCPPCGFQTCCPDGCAHGAACKFLHLEGESLQEFQKTHTGEFGYTNNLGVPFRLCKDDGKCTKASCNYRHSMKMCPSNCGKKECAMRHTMKACKFGLNCKNRTTTCKFTHPTPVCRYGQGCKNRYTTCKFKHDD